MSNQTVTTMSFTDTQSKLKKQNSSDLSTLAKIPISQNIRSFYSCLINELESAKFLLNDKNRVHNDFQVL